MPHHDAWGEKIKKGAEVFVLNHSKLARVQKVVRKKPYAVVKFKGGDGKTLTLSTNELVVQT